MFSRTRTVWLAIPVMALGLAGCNRPLHFDRTLSMGPGDVKSFSVDPPRREQKVTVSFKSTETPVDVYVLLDKDLEAASNAIQNFKAPQGVLASKMKSRDGSVEATIPAKTAFGVIVAGSNKDTSVDVKIAGK
jgi:hypothetical protein